MSRKSISPILTLKKFNKLLEEKYDLDAIEWKMVEKHMFHHQNLKYSKAIIENTHKKQEYWIVIITKDVTKFKIMQEHLMLFELDSNKDELESG